MRDVITYFVYFITGVVHTGMALQEEPEDELFLKMEIAIYLNRKYLNVVYDSYRTCSLLSSMPSGDGPYWCSHFPSSCPG